MKVNRVKLKLSDVETQMEVLTKEEMDQLRGGIGEDIIVLFDPNAAHGLGHTAILIGDDTSGYRYYSVNGTKLGGPFGSNYKPDLGKNEYKSLGSFLQEYKGKENKEYDYRHFVLIKTSPEEDAMAHIVAGSVAGGSDYSIFGSSCIDVPQEVIKAVYSKKYGVMGSFMTSISGGILIPMVYLYELKAFYGDEIEI